MCRFAHLQLRSPLRNLERGSRYLRGLLLTRTASCYVLYSVVTTVGEASLWLYTALAYWRDSYIHLRFVGDTGGSHSLPSTLTDNANDPSCPD
jgi:hypothetical protein